MMMNSLARHALRVLEFQNYQIPYFSRAFLEFWSDIFKNLTLIPIFQLESITFFKEINQHIACFHTMTAKYVAIKSREAIFFLEFEKI